MSEETTRLQRNRSIHRAISTSLLSKGSTAVLQFVSLPLAARVLGRAEFGIYSTISLAVLMVAILQLGVGPALGASISEASSKADREREGRLYRNGAILITIAALIGFVLAALLISILPVSFLFGAKYAPYAESMVPALWTGLVLMIGLLMVEMTDRVREGYMESASVNVSSAVGNLGGAILVFVGISFQPTVSFLLVAVFGPNILARLINTLLLLRKRPWLIRGSFWPDREIVITLIKDGLSFSATSFAVYLAEFTICALIIGRILGPSDVAIFEVLMAITASFTGLLVMVGRPVWAAIIDAKARQDHDWMVSAACQYYRYLAVLSLLAAVGLIGLGPWIVPKLYGPEFTVSRIVFAGHTAFLLAIGWRHVNRYLAIGLGLIGQTVKPILGGVAVGMALGFAGLLAYGLPALFFGLAAGVLVIPGITLPSLVWKKLEPTNKRNNQDTDLAPKNSASATPQVAAE